jgi:phosphate butyryltransferase
MDATFKFHDYTQLIEAARKLGQAKVVFAAAQDAEVVEAAKMAQELGLAEAILVGDAKTIRSLAQDASLPKETRILHEADVDRAALKSVELVHNGEAQVLVKGQVNSSNFLRAALDPNIGLRTGRILSHLAVYEIPGEDKLAFLTDGGMNIAPNLEQKKEILVNAVEALRKIGYAQPNVAVLAANEQINPKMPATLDALELVKLWQAGEFPPCLVEGPIALDVATGVESARRKGIDSQVAGKVDIFLAPNIEAGNLMGKTLMRYAGAKMAGVVLGATNPMVLVSRSDNAESKVNSIALACLLVHER